MIDFRLSEHQELKFYKEKEEALEAGFPVVSVDIFQRLSEFKPRVFSEDNACFDFVIGENFHKISAGYYVGLDWMGETDKTILVEPKLNVRLTDYFNRVTEESDEDSNGEEPFEKTEEELTSDSFRPKDFKEINYLRMLLTVMANPITAREVHRVFKIYWDEDRIEVKQTEDKLTPFLVVQFLQLLKSIVKKGLKKSYYKTRKNFRNKIKGKILVGDNIKQNVFKNRLNATVCEYQDYGINSLENRFLKKVMRFCFTYVHKHRESVFKDNYYEIKHLLDYCKPAFEKVGDELPNLRQIVIRPNAFFVEYKEALKIGRYILHQFGFALSKTQEEKVASFPFWIDMPILFELYFYTKILKANPDKKRTIRYQFSTYGNSLDFLIADKEKPLIIDTKYKPHYNKGQIHKDIRQVSGYARLKKVRKKVGVFEDKLISCLIVYPLIDAVETEPNLGFNQLNDYLKFSPNAAIRAYERVYKIGIKLPLIGE